jgi:hypothetical protein
MFNLILIGSSMFLGHVLTILYYKNRSLDDMNHIFLLYSMAANKIKIFITNLVLTIKNLPSKLNRKYNLL